MTLARRAVPSATRLDEILSPQSLRRAWRHVRANQGVPGLDGISLHRFGLDLDQNLAAIAREVRAGCYQPRPALATRIQTSGKERVLSIPAVRDRVLQRSTLDVLAPQCEQHFAATSFAYRPRRGVPDALELVRLHRDLGNRWVLDADIRDCFGQFDHGVLRAAVREFIADRDVRDLLDIWISAEEHASGVPRGIPLGAVISPFFCNLYLHRLDMSFIQEGLLAIRYADDFIVLCRTKREAMKALRVAERELDALRLELNPAKTQVAHFDSGFTFLGVAFRGATCTPVKGAAQWSVSM